MLLAASITPVRNSIDEMCPSPTARRLMMNLRSPSRRPVSANVRTIGSVPLKLSGTRAHPVPARIEVRGEVFIARRDFERLNAARVEAGLPPFANPSAAPGQA